MNARRLATKIDHTLLRPEITWREIEQLCVEAQAYQFAAVCVNPCWVALAERMLRESPIAVCTVVGFPLGATTPTVKAREASVAVEHGAREIDMVLNVGRLRGGELGAVGDEIRIVRRALGAGLTLKVILETALLTDEEKRTAARLAVDAGADYVKTSTGMNVAGGATVTDVRLLVEAVGGRAKVKAAGGIRNTAIALAMLEAGADRIGTSAGVAIVDGLSAELSAALAA
ncbi:MAG TPA: deoxyribose-phosphate aldolase [Chloroflexota bacterium]|nr:deoxyribose-phosphate aldolase [Chloroflexota bacterium]